MILLIIVCATVNLVAVDICQNRQSYYTAAANEIREVTLGQHEWLYDLNKNIFNQGDFSEGLSAEACAFGKWYSSHSRSIDKSLLSGLSEAAASHEKLHALAADALALAKTDVDGAGRMMDGQIRPLFEQMVAGSGQFIDFFTGKSDKFHVMLIAFIIIAICSNLLFFFLAWFFAGKLGDRLSRKISNPITAVAKWSEELSNGSADLQFEKESFNCDLSEINTMIQSFEKMAESIEENVRVVQKVADGDMTAFVNVRSASDSLGKNLYRMVQSNDIMFAEISQIAQSVAQGARSISQASSSLAESCNVQASAVQQFKASVEDTSNLIHSNNEQAHDAHSLSEEIKEEIHESAEKMSQLLSAMGEIKQASEKVSGMIASIEELASQTNLLALNAAIEAARAGVAGKGFAVVADEVKNLAAKSAQAADESNRLVEDTIRKTALGDILSQETSESFAKIQESVQKIAGVTSIISENSARQEMNIAAVQDSIQEIAGSIEANAAASQEAAAQSSELKHNAFALRESMNKFNLRKRTPGKPYIPPEKRDDLEFIREAEENYRKALQTGKVKLPQQALTDGIG